MTLHGVFRTISSFSKANGFFGTGSSQAQPGKLARFGLGLSGGSLVGVGMWVLLVDPFLLLTQGLAAGLFALGIFNLFSTFRNGLSLLRVNQFSLGGYVVSLVAMYVFASRFVMVGYTTDTIVGTYMAVLRVLQLQSPYGFSIKPLLDKFGFSPSFYTPGVNGSFDFHIAYPSLSFLSVLPFYVLGLHDVRDTIFIFFALSILLIFGLAPPRLKSVSVAPFGLFPFVIAGSWTDSVWAFFLVLTTLLWYRYPKASWASFGLAVAAKQIAIVVAPFLLIRLWHENPQTRMRSLGTNVGLMLAAFFLPNLPFIISTPASWWADVVAPFLPNTPAQVPGGIGLSSLLLDLGIALPSSFFLVLMLGASTALLYLYARRYRGLNSLVFAFPILVFFFYYRSFPNYMAFWLFPLVFELCRLGGPNLRIAFTMRLPSIAWHAPTGTFLRILRQRLTPTLMVVIALTMALVGVSGAYMSQASNPEATIQINGVMDPDSIGAATLINVTVTNLSSVPISPIFFVKYGPLPYFWASNSSVPLSSGSVSSYMIGAPDALSAVPRGDQFHILVGNKLTGQLLGESSSWKANIAAPSLENPGLKWWVLDTSVGSKVPFNWKLSLSNTDPVWSGITPLGVNGTSGVQMILNYSSPLVGLGNVALSQKVLLNATSVVIRFNQSLTTNIASNLIFAASVADGTHTLYYVFSDQTAHQTITSYPSNTTVIIPTERSQWNTIRLTPESIWNSQGWAIPQQATLTLFLESGLPGVYYVSIFSVVPA
ncbi:hypothetical protein AUI06_11435 [archaeon 13_2_20CM_2_52_21]|nr:MAG: hypothetical protein AUI06_11435 [archaeon 13_2_20CM_2_52_21]